MNKYEMHKQIVAELSETYRKKNADYGDSFAHARKEVPHYTLGRIYDKFSRYKNLSLSGRASEIDETVTDTLLDMANYCIMEVIELTMEVTNEN